MGYLMKDRVRSPQDGPSHNGERRATARRPAQGEVFIYLDSIGPSPVLALLLDISSDGFRATHPRLLLPPGQEVCFRCPQAAGVARVMWNRIDGDEMQTGFLILEHWPA